MKTYIVLLLMAVGFGCVSCTDNDFQTPDLALYALKGKVKECYTYYFEAIEKNGEFSKGDSLGYRVKELRYSPEGGIIYISEYGPLSSEEITIERNNLGRIVELYSISPVSEEDGGGTFTQGEKWEYDAQGRPCRNNCYNDVAGEYADLRVEYDENNNESKMERKGRYPSITTFQYLEFDKHTNWTKRIAIHEEEPWEPRKQYEERVITYYD